MVLAKVAALLARRRILHRILPWQALFLLAARLRVENSFLSVSKRFKAVMKIRSKKPSQLKFLSLNTKRLKKKIGIKALIMINALRLGIIPPVNTLFATSV